MYIRTIEGLARGPLQYGLGDWVESKLPAATNGRLYGFDSKNGGSTTAVYVPDAARGADRLNLLVWIHGDRVCGGEGPDAVSYLKSNTFPLTRQIADSKRPFVLVVPSMNWKSGQNSHTLGSPQKMNAFLEEVRAGLTAAGWSSPPSFGRLILAGHSRGYAVLNGLAARVNDPESSQGALATLTDMWLLDSTYGKSRKEALSDAWLKWAKAKGNVNLRILYRRNTDTAAVAESIREKAARAGMTNVAFEVFEPGSLSHCAMPRVRMPHLLAGAGGRAPSSTGARVPRPIPLPRPAAPQAPQPSNGSLSQRIQSALAGGQWYAALGLAVLSGNRDANGLTSLLFFARHPELKGRKLAATDPLFKQLSREWLDIRDRLVRPFLEKRPAVRPGAPSQPSVPRATLSKSKPCVQAGSCTACERRLHATPPPQLKDVPVEFRYHERREHLDAQALQAYQNMVRAARAEGISSPYLKLVSGFRDYDKQGQLWRGRLLTLFKSLGCSESNLPCIASAIDRTTAALKSLPIPHPAGAWLTRFLAELRNGGCASDCDPRKAVQQLRAWTAPPGTSPHHTGRAIDIHVGGEISRNAKNVAFQRKQAAYQWLVCNAARFGFYPYNVEPWHWEYNPPS
jgi:hypothetical protein